MAHPNKIIHRKFTTFLECRKKFAQKSPLWYQKRKTRLLIIGSNTRLDFIIIYKMSHFVTCVTFRDTFDYQHFSNKKISKYRFFVFFCDCHVSWHPLDLHTSMYPLIIIIKFFYFYLKEVSRNVTVTKKLKKIRNLPFFISKVLIINCITTCHACHKSWHTHKKRIF